MSRKIIFRPIVSILITVLFLCNVIAYRETEEFKDYPLSVDTNFFATLHNKDEFLCAGFLFTHNFVLIPSQCMCHETQKKKKLHYNVVLRLRIGQQKVGTYDNSLQEAAEVYCFNLYWADYNDPTSTVGLKGYNVAIVKLRTGITDELKETAKVGMIGPNPEPNEKCTLIELEATTTLFPRKFTALGKCVEIDSDFCTTDLSEYEKKHFICGTFKSSQSYTGKYLGSPLVCKGGIVGLFLKQDKRGRLFFSRISASNQFITSSSKHLTTDPNLSKLYREDDFTYFFDKMVSCDF